jgi:hypothetical protein
VRKAHDTVGTKGDRPRRHRFVYEPQRRFAERLFEQGQGGSLDGGDELQERACRFRKRANAFSNQLFQRRWHGKPSAQRCFSLSTDRANSSANIGLPPDAAWRAATFERGRRTSKR